LSPEWAIDRALGEELKAKGKTRFFGFSCHDGNVVELLNKAAETGGIDAILFRYNFRRYGDLALNRAIDACHRKGIAMLAMKTQGAVPKEIESVVEFRSQNFTLGQAKLESVWADERIASIVSEMDNVALVRENVAAARSEVSLTAEESHQLNQLDGEDTLGEGPNFLAVLAGAASGHRPGHLVHVDPHAADRLVQAVEAGSHVRDAEVHHADATIQVVGALLHASDAGFHPFDMAGDLLHLGTEHGHQVDVAADGGDRLFHCVHAGGDAVDVAGHRVHARDDDAHLLGQVVDEVEIGQGERGDEHNHDPDQQGYAAGTLAGCLLALGQRLLQVGEDLAQAFDAVTVAHVGFLLGWPLYRGRRGVGSY